MIASVTMKSFKAHSETKINWDLQIAVLVGPNGSGKTSCLQAVDAMVRLAGLEADADKIFSFAMDPKEIQKRGSGSPASLEISGVHSVPVADGHVRGVQWSVSATLGDRGARRKTEWKYDKKRGQTSENNLYRISMVDGDLREGEKLAPEELAAAVGGVAYHRFNPRLLAEGIYSPVIPPVLEHDGSGLAPFVSNLMTEHPDRFEQLLWALRKVVPQVRRIRVRPTKIERTELRTMTVNGSQVAIPERREYVGHTLVFDFAGADDVPARAVSDGTLLTLGVLAALWGPERPNMVLLDDLEQALHPLAQKRLMEQLRNVLQMFPTLQIMATTHSPYLVDSLSPEEVWVLGSRPDGSVAARRMDEHPQRERALQVLTTGEFWSSEGEGWVTGSP